MSTSGEGPSPNWLELPRDITASILRRLGAIEILNNAQRVCSQWRSICKEPSMWTTIDMRNAGDLFDIEMNLEVMCRHAVDRSCGGLVDINIEYLGTDELLEYITASCTGIKRLRLVCCYDITVGLEAASSKLPLLEDLELSYCSSPEDFLEALGLHSPLLKSLKLHEPSSRYTRIASDEKALAIAKTMPELRHLRLICDNLTNVGLNAILDGCPGLESLDLRCCYNVDLSGELGKRCAEQVKDLRRPSDSTHDYEFTIEPQDGVFLDEDSSVWFSDGFPEWDYYNFSGDETDGGDSSVTYTGIDYD